MPAIDMPSNELAISAVHALQLLDSRGYPTVQVRLDLEDDRSTGAAAPSGASTGAHEAVELRDHDDHYGGRGVAKAAAGVEGSINELHTSRSWPDLCSLDRALCDLDGTEQKLRLGANAMVGVSMAAARAFAATAAMPLHSWIAAHWAGAGRDVTERLPVPHFNVLNGGGHAANALVFQEFMIAPVGAQTLPETMEWGVNVYHALGALRRARGLSTGLGDEGGFAPAICLPEEAPDLIMSAIGNAHLTPDINDAAIALDPPANSFFRELGSKVQIVGDDLFVTDAGRVRAGAAAAAATAVLIKPNQVGTVSETFATLAAAESAGFATMVPHRSGGTIDSFVADLAVGAGSGQLKSGAPARGERLAKYNRLIEIAAANPFMPYGTPAAAGKGTP